MEAIALSWELYASIAETIKMILKGLISERITWRIGHKSMNKNKVMISGECQKRIQKAARWPRGRGDDSNSIYWTSCQKWVHRSLVI